MTSTHLPAATYEEALPDLRAPYQPSQIRALITAAPKSMDAPCTIGLYTTGETPIDRFNLCCASNWSKTFTVEIHEEREKEVDGKKRTFHYYKVTCSLTVLGNEQEDFGEGEAQSAAMAEWEARAQAFKRTARWHGPGQCLYLFGSQELKMWRGTGPRQLRIPTSGNEPHRHPYFDKAARQTVRDEYDKWLKDEGQSLFGAPLNHLEVATAIRERALHQSGITVPDLSHVLPDLSPTQLQPPDALTTAEAPAHEGDSTSEEQHPVDAGNQTAPAAIPHSRQQIQRLPMPDEPATQETVTVAESGGFTAAVAHALSNLARSDAQASELTERQHKTVVNWLITLSELRLTSDEITKAVQFVASKGTTQEARQATFTRWLSGKASSQSPETRTPAATALGETSRSSEQPAPDRDTGEPTDQPAATAEDTETLDAERALRRINVTMDARGYTDQTVTQLAKLAIGTAPRGRLEWAKIPAPTMLVLAELLESAATLDWTPQALANEVLAAHNARQQSTPAGRFSAFAGHLTNLAESRTASEAA
jgi:hypothetical protein